MFRKISNKKGFTLAETLVAMIIMLMVSSIVAAGIPAAKSAYEKIVLTSNAQLSLSTAVYALRNELSSAREITVSSTGKISYTSGTYGSRSEISVGDEGIMYKRYADSEKESERRLVSESASDRLVVKYGGVEQKDGYITFTDICVYKSNGTDEVLKQDELSIMTL